MKVPPRVQPRRATKAATSKKQSPARSRRTTSRGAAPDAPALVPPPIYMPRLPVISKERRARRTSSSIIRPPRPPTTTPSSHFPQRSNNFAAPVIKPQLTTPAPPDPTAFMRLHPQHGLIQRHQSAEILNLNQNVGVQRQPNPRPLQVNQNEDEENEEEPLHQAFFTDLYDALRKLEIILGIMRFDFDNSGQLISIGRIRKREICRKNDNNHVEHLKICLEDIKDGHFDKILNRSLFVVHEMGIDDDGAQLYGIVEGNMRFQAVLDYNAASSGETIDYIRADVIIFGQPTRPQAIIISTLASETAEKDRLPYSAAEILENARAIMLNQPDILKFGPPADNATTARQWKRQKEKELRIELSRILKVDPLKVLSSTWRTTYISEEHFGVMLPCLARHGNGILRLEKLCNMYRKRTVEVFELCTTNEIVNADHEIFFAALNEIRGEDFHVSLKGKGAFNENISNDQHLRIIMGTKYDEIDDHLRSKYMEAFLKSKEPADVTRSTRYPTVNSRLAFLTTKFAAWIATGPDIHAQPPENDSNDDTDNEQQQQPQSAAAAAEAMQPQQDDAAVIANGGRGNRSRANREPNPNPRIAQELRLSSIKLEEIETKYLRPLQAYPAVASLVAHIFKKQSKNMNEFPVDNAILRAAAEYETASGGFNYAAFTNSLNQYHG